MAGIKLFFQAIIFLLSVFTALFSVAGAIAPYISPVSSGFIAVAGLLLPFSLAGNLFFLLYWLICRNRTGWLSFFAILININFVFSVFQFTSSAPQEGNNKEMIIATHNIQRFLTKGETTFHKIASWAREKEIDVLSFQEYDELHFSGDSIKAIFNSYPYSVRFDKENKLATFSKHPIIRSQIIDFQSEKGHGLWMDLLVSNDTVRLFNIHLQTTSVSVYSRQYYTSKKTGNTPDESVVIANTLSGLKNNYKERARQADLLRQIIDTTRYPVIVNGDFNDTPASYVYHEIKGKLTDGFHQCGNGYGYTFKGFYKLLRIDYIFYSPGFSGMSYDSPHTPWSDHNPVIMKLSYQ